MSDTQIIYEGDLRTKCIHLDSGSEIFTDAPKDNQGLGERFSPTDLVAVALASCILTIMGIYAKGLKVDLKGTKTNVTKEMEKMPSRKIGRIKIVINCPNDFSPDVKSRLEKGGLSCPVHHSLHPDVKQEITFNWGVKEA